MVVKHIQTNTQDYLVMDFGDPRITVYRRREGRYKDPTEVDFRTPEDYRRFIRDLNNAQMHPDDMQADIVIETLLEKLKVEWPGKE